MYNNRYEVLNNNSVFVDVNFRIGYVWCGIDIFLMFILSYIIGKLYD